MGRRQHCFCAFCRTERWIYPEKHVQPRQLVFVLIAALAIHGIFSLGEFDFQIIFPVAAIFAALCLVLEIAMQLRWRFQLICPHCHFDPILYLSSQEKASNKVKLQLERRKKDPRTLLGLNPILNIPKRRKSSSHKLSENNG